LKEEGGEPPGKNSSRKKEDYLSKQKSIEKIGSIVDRIGYNVRGKREPSRKREGGKKSQPTICEDGRS